MKNAKVTISAAWLAENPTVDVGETVRRYMASCSEGSTIHLLGNDEWEKDVAFLRQKMELNKRALARASKKVG